MGNIYAAKDLIMRGNNALVDAYEEHFAAVLSAWGCRIVCMVGYDPDVVRLRVTPRNHIEGGESKPFDIHVSTLELVRVRIEARSLHDGNGRIPDPQGKP